MHISIGLKNRLAPDASLSKMNQRARPPIILPVAGLLKKLKLQRR